MSGPRPPGGGEGRWHLLGEAAVDGASLAVVEVSTTIRAVDHDTKSLSWAVDYGGVGFWAGFGDGCYEVWGWIITDPEGFEQVAQVVVTMIDAEAWDEWVAGE